MKIIQTNIKYSICICTYVQNSQVIPTFRGLNWIRFIRILQKEKSGLFSAQTALKSDLLLYTVLELAVKQFQTKSLNLI